MRSLSLAGADRFRTTSYRLFPSVREAAVVFKPETLVRWHRSGFRLYWRWKSRRGVGRPAVPEICTRAKLLAIGTVHPLNDTITSQPVMLAGARQGKALTVMLATASPSRTPRGIEPGRPHRHCRANHPGGPSSPFREKRRSPRSND